MDLTKSKQDNNVVFGHQAGRDVTNNYYYDSSKNQSTMSRLIGQYKSECELDQEFCGIIEKLEHYQKNVDATVKGLEEKLKDGGQEYLLDFAKYTKEVFVKKIAEFEFYESAQKIFAFLLAEIYSKFHRIIYPKLTTGIDQNELNELVQREIIEPVQEILEENILDIYSDEINGMLFFLTGNCHIKWS